MEFFLLEDSLNDLCVHAVVISFVLLWLYLLVRYRLLYLRFQEVSFIPLRVGACPQSESHLSRSIG
jgi:hypothetical protein